MEISTEMFLKAVKTVHHMVQMLLYWVIVYNCGCFTGNGIYIYIPFNSTQVASDEPFPNSKAFGSC